MENIARKVSAVRKQIIDYQLHSTRNAHIFYKMYKMGWILLNRIG
jgi:hypothetical protein